MLKHRINAARAYRIPLNLHDRFERVSYTKMTVVLLFILMPTDTVFLSYELYVGGKRGRHLEKRIASHSTVMGFDPGRFNFDPFC